MSTTALVCGEMTDSVPSWRLATQTLVASTAIADGPCPTGIVWRIVNVFLSRRETTPRSSSLTHTAPAPAAIAGRRPVKRDLPGQRTAARAR